MNRASRRAEIAEARAKMLEVELDRIVACSAMPDGEWSMVWDWRDIAAEMAGYARAALARGD